MDEPHQRLAALSRQWGVTVDSVSRTDTSRLAFGSRRGHPVVLKVIERHGDEWHSGQVLQAFGGRGVVRLYESVPGAVLLERAMPADSLVGMATDGRDDNATRILADVIHRMSGCTPPISCATVHDWGKGFDRYVASRDEHIPSDLVAAAQRSYAQLGSSQRTRTLLHGDLHHYNVLRDRHRGWLAVDPKGLVGELEYELGAALRNPVERPELFTSRNVFEERLATFARLLPVDADRVRRWAFAQAVLSAIWAIQDGSMVNAEHPTLSLATMLFSTSS